MVGSSTEIPAGWAGIALDTEVSERASQHAEPPQIGVDGAPALSGWGRDAIVVVPPGEHQVEAQQYRPQDRVFVTVAADEVVKVRYQRAANQPGEFRTENDDRPLPVDREAFTGGHRKTVFFLAGFLAFLASLFVFCHTADGFHEEYAGEGNKLFSFLFGWVFFMAILVVPYAVAIVAERFVGPGISDPADPRRDPRSDATVGQAGGEAPRLMRCDEGVPVPPTGYGGLLLDLRFVAYQNEANTGNRVTGQDWMSPPSMRIDGEDVPVGWGRWWYPLRQGSHHITVQHPALAERRIEVSAGAAVQMVYEAEVVFHRNHGGGPVTGVETTAHLMTDPRWAQGDNRVPPVIEAMRPSSGSRGSGHTQLEPETTPLIHDGPPRLEWRLSATQRRAIALRWTFWSIFVVLSLLSLRWWALPASDVVSVTVGVSAFVVLVGGALGGIVWLLSAYRRVVVDDMGVRQLSLFWDTGFRWTRITDIEIRESYGLRSVTLIFDDDVRRRLSTPRSSWVARDPDFAAKCAVLLERWRAARDTPEPVRPESRPRRRWQRAPIAGILIALWLIPYHMLNVHNFWYGYGLPPWRSTAALATELPDPCSALSAGQLRPFGLTPMSKERQSDSTRLGRTKGMCTWSGENWKLEVGYTAYFGRGKFPTHQAEEALSRGCARWSHSIGAKTALSGLGDGAYLRVDDKGREAEFQARRDNVSVCVSYSWKYSEEALSNQARFDLLAATGRTVTDSVTLD